ncbi:hypothetical protein [Aeromicrobium sp. UC242_57]|uniref:hypothetical protein n=1 Tax=Aeromicrobium sp. UC242_57 TaxID=3374624 RepID=UPI003798EBAD
MVDEAAGARGKIVKIDIADGKASPQGDRVEVKSGQRVRLVMTSDVAEEIHVHSDPEHTFQPCPASSSLKRSRSIVQVRSRSRRII